MKLILQKNHASTEQLADAFDRYYPHLYRYFRLRGANAEEAKDLTSMTFENALRHLPRYDSQKSQIQTWLFSIAHNLAVNHWKAETTQETHPLDENVPDLQSGDLEKRIIARENQEQILQAIQQLDSNSRQIIALKFGGPLTNRQIGQLMGLKEQNVAVILYRALLKLRKILAQDEVHYD
ncbi:MAG: RNA polymerase sigma factor [Anaerolineales bacterium]